MIHKAEFLMPGVFMPEETVTVITAHTPEAAVAVAPESAYCLTLFDVEEAPDLGPDFRVVPTAKNKSARYYLGGTIHTLASVEALGLDILASNMSANNWPHVVHCRTGNWQPFAEGDVIVDPETGLITARAEHAARLDRAFGVDA